MLWKITNCMEDNKIKQTLKCIKKRDDSKNLDDLRDNKVNNNNNNDSENH